VVSTVLVVERSEEGKAHGVQRPVYFISEVLSPTKKGIRTTKSLHTVFSQQLGNYGNTLRSTQS
jgi:hypothetical protein